MVSCEVIGESSVNVARTQEPRSGWVIARDTACAKRKQSQDNLRSHATVGVNLQEHRMPQPPVDDMRLPHAALECLQARLYFGDHAFVDHTARHEFLATSGVQAAHERLIAFPVEEDAGRIGEKYELLSL